MQRAMRVAVLGGGLQGACVALELASSGVAVHLYDENDRCLTQASSQNEGKIHLGYVYANDKTLRTARAMVSGGTAFAPLLRRWLGTELDRIGVSSPFYYAVHTDGLLGADEIERYLRAAHELALACDRPVDYFGSDYREPPRRLRERELDALFDSRRVVAAFATAEIGIDAEGLSDLIRARLSTDECIEQRLRTRVLGVDTRAHRPTVTFGTSDGLRTEAYDHVVNTLWDGRLAVDRPAGIEPHRRWLYRIKHYLRVRAPSLWAKVPSATVVLGPFGDIAAYGDGNYYLSWYPAGMRGSSAALAPPPWPRTLANAAALELRAAILSGLKGIVPAMSLFTAGSIETCEVKGGIIFAWGATDIDDPRSGLHERYAIGPVTRGRYHTIDTGKLTMAPLFGKQMAERIRGAA